STYSVISPEGAAALLWKDAGQAKRAAETMGITSYDLKKLNIIDEIIKEPRGGAHRDMKQQADYINQTIENSLSQLITYNEEELLEKRWEKFKQMGEFSSL